MKITEPRFIVKRKYRLSVAGVVHNFVMDKPGQRIRGLRKERKLTQPQITDATGIPQSTLSEIERGESKEPSSEVLLKLADFFEVEPAWILTGRGPKHTVSSRGDGESELLLFYRSLSSEGKAYLLARARDLHTGEHEERPGSKSGGRQDPDGTDDKLFQ